MLSPAENPAAPALIELIEASVYDAETPSRVTVEDISWKVQAGDFWIVAGLQSSGKSDLLNTAAGLQRPECGRHFLFGRETSRLSEQELLEQRLKVGVVFEQGGRLFTRLTLAQNIALPLCYHQNCSEPDALDQVATMLDFIGLGPVGELLPGRVNRNTRQRTALARALILRPEILMLDNPLAGLDSRETRWWISMLTRLAAGEPALNAPPMTIVVTTDDLRPWLNHARNFGFLNQRRWHPLGGRDGVAGCDDPFVRDLLLTAN